MRKCVRKKNGAKRQERKPKQAAMAAARENLAPQVIQRVAKEIRNLVQSPPNGIRYLPQDDEVLTEIHVEIAGPENTPYDGGFFLVKLSLSDGFPHAPPKGVFLTKIFHPNIATNGEICVNTLKKDWTPELGIAHVLQVIRCLLIVPFPESSLNDEAGRLFMESYDEYARRARLWTGIHAPKESAAKEDVQDAKQKKADTENSKEKSKLTIKEQAEPQASEVEKEKKGENDNTKATPSVRVVTKPGEGGTATAKKRPSPTSMDALAAQKKKSTLKKGIKRL